MKIIHKRECIYANGANDHLFLMLSHKGWKGMWIENEIKDLVESKLI